MHNSIPYLILIAVFIPLLIWTIAKAHQPGLLMVFFTYVGMGFVVEFFILVVFDGYQYKPHLLRVPYYDNVMGAVVSDILSVPIIALVVAVFQMRFRWIVGFAVGFGLIEKVFMQLGVYQTNWWTIWFTVILFAINFWIARWWLRTITKRYRAFLHALSVFFTAFSLICTALFITLVGDVHLDLLHLFADPYRDSVCTDTIYGVVEALVMTVVQFFRPKHLLWKSAVVLFSVLFQAVLSQANIVHILINPFYYYLMIVLCCSLIVWLLSLMNRWFLRMVSNCV